MAKDGARSEAVIKVAVGGAGERRRGEEGDGNVRERLRIDGDEDVVERAAGVWTQVAAIVQVGCLALLIGDQKRVVEDVMGAVGRLDLVALECISKAEDGGEAGDGHADGRKAAGDDVGVDAAAGGGLNVEHHALVVEIVNPVVMEMHIRGDEV